MEWRLINAMAIRTIWLLFLFHLVQNFVCIQNIMNYFILNPPLLNLLDILTIENTFKFQAFKFIHNWHIKKLPSIFTNSFTYASKDNIHKVRTRTNIGKQTIASLASELWQELPTDLKNLSSNCFSKQVKQHLLRKQSYF